ncbi:ATP synthase, F0 complex, subunit b/b', bacterial/chloroplast like protein, partial [Aduncisulcus paluster]
MVFQIVNTLILFFFLKKLLFKPVTEFMEKREQEIAGEYNEAAKLQQEAEDKKTEYINRIAKSDEEGKKIIRDATAKAENRASEIVKQAEKDASELKVKAQHDIEREQVK